MKLKFETWIVENHFPENAKNLFGTSVDCYKAQAYSASFLMAYLGFLVTLKERVMSAEKPNLFPSAVWKNLMANLKNEDRWEESIFDASMQKEKTDSAKPANKTQDPVFVINDNLRTQIRYWKDRRNDCVHNKDNIITISHVETFWTFLESNLQKITVEGGKFTLLNKFKRHFDSSYTAANEEIDPLIKEIRSAVSKNEREEFWEQLFFNVADLWDYSNEFTLITKILKINDPEISQSLILHLKSDEKFLKAYINEHPSIIGLLGYTKAEIRNFWNTKIGNMSNVMAVYASLLRNNLIPAEEIKEANAKMAYYYKYTESADDHYILSSYGFGEVLYELLFVYNNGSNRKYWEFMNTHYILYTKYIESYELKDEVVKVLCEELGKTEWVSYFLRESLDRLFTRNPSKMREFKEKASRINLALPSQIVSLNV